MANIIIEMSGGILQAVYSDDKDLRYTVVDHDENNDGREFKEFEPDGFFHNDEKDALLNYLTNYGGITETLD